MVEKQDAVKMIEKCIKTEESAIPLYTQHINNTLFLSGFKEGERARIKEVLAILKEQSERHREIFEEILRKLRTRGKDVH